MRYNYRDESDRGDETVPPHQGKGKGKGEAKEKGKRKEERGLGLRGLPAKRSLNISLSKCNSSIFPSVFGEVFSP